MRVRSPVQWKLKLDEQFIFFFSCLHLKLQLSLAKMQEIALSKRFIPLTPKIFEREGWGCFRPSVLPTLLMTPDCRRSLMRIKWAPFLLLLTFTPPPSPHAMQAFLLPISPIGRSLHHRGCQSGKAPTAGRPNFGPLHV